MKGKKQLLYIWNTLYDFYIRVKDTLFYVKDRIYSLFVRSPQIMGINDTLDFMIATRCSVSRFGDAEMKVVKGMHISYQAYDDRLTTMLREVLSVPVDNHIVCLPDVFDDLSKYNKENQLFWKKHLAYNRPLWYRYIDRKRLFYDAFVSRCYLMHNDKSSASGYFSKFKQLWNNRSVVIVEGEKSRLGVGNDLFDNVNTIKRILGPNTNAFQYYDDIYREVTKNDKDVLILLALGPTATVLAYNLAKAGYQAIDIGHIDIEYEWYKLGVTHKVPIKNKYVHEAGAGKDVGDIDDKKYLSEIIWHF